MFWADAAAAEAAAAADAAAEAAAAEVTAAGDGSATDADFEDLVSLTSHESVYLAPAFVPVSVLQCRCVTAQQAATIVFCVAGCDGEAAAPSSLGEPCKAACPGCRWQQCSVPLLI